MAVKLKDPQSESSPPVGFIAVDDNGVIAFDAFRTHQISKSRGIHDIAGILI